MPRKPDDPRALELNSQLWGRLNDLARQVEWPMLFDGHVRMSKLSAEDWKDVLSGSLERQLRMAAGVECGLVLLGQRTSKFTNAKMEKLCALAKLVGDSHQVRWSAPKRLEPEWDLRNATKRPAARTAGA